MEDDLEIHIEHWFGIIGDPKFSKKIDKVFRSFGCTNNLQFDYKSKDVLYFMYRNEHNVLKVSGTFLSDTHEQLGENLIRLAKSKYLSRDHCYTISEFLNKCFLPGDKVLIYGTIPNTIGDVIYNPDEKTFSYTLCDGNDSELVWKSSDLVKDGD